jgi:hypothetical protein
VPLVWGDARPAAVVGGATAAAAGVIARAAAASALHGTARLGAELGVPAATVPGWLRRLRSRADQMLQEATSEFGRLVAVIETPEGRDPCPPGPAGSPLGDALALVIACAIAAIRWHGRAKADLDALIGQFGLAAALSPPPEADPAPSRAFPCPESDSDAHHENPASSTARTAATVSIPPTSVSISAFPRTRNARF